MMPESPTVPPNAATPLEVEWRSDNSNQIRLVAWYTQQVRRSKAFRRHRARQLISAHAIMVFPAIALAFVLSTSGGSFPRIVLGAGAFLAVSALFFILRGAKLSTPAALRLAAQFNKAGAIADTSGRWRFRLDEERAAWEWLDHGSLTSWPVDRLDPPQVFDGTLVFSSGGMPIGVVPLSALKAHDRAMIEQRLTAKI